MWGGDDGETGVALGAGSAFVKARFVRPAAGGGGDDGGDTGGLEVVVQA